MIDDDDYGAVGGMRIGRGNQSTRRKPTPVPLCPPQIPHNFIHFIVNPGTDIGCASCLHCNCVYSGSISFTVIFAIDIIFL
jgi:hypothetical protein